MKKRIIIFLMAISLSFNCYLESKTPEVIFRAYTQKEEFRNVLWIISDLKWLDKHGYKVELPQNAVFCEFYSCPEKLRTANLEELEKIFANEIYQESDFDKGLEIIQSDENSIIYQSLEKLEKLNENWGFEIMSTYEVCLTLYGTRGAYYFYDGRGEIITRTDKDGYFGIKNVFNTIVHEIVHIGIEGDIVRGYKLSHWEKERLVDLICSRYLKLPGYYMQKIKSKIDSFVSEESIMMNLTKAVENYIKSSDRYTEKIT